MPSPPRDYGDWSRKAALFWRLPTHLALAIRLSDHLYREARFRLAGRKFDVYHEAAFFPFSPIKDLQTVFTIHDLSLIRYPQFHPRERVLFSKLFLRRRCRGVKSFLTVSDFTRNEASVLLGLRTGLMTTTHLAHDSEIFFQRKEAEVHDALIRFTVPEKYFLFVGTGDPRKNLSTVERALQLSGINIPLVVAGWSGWDKEQAGRNRARFLGYVDDEDLARLYSGAVALLYPSTYEGFGLPILEAMACGCPIICSHRASLPEVAGNAALYLKDPTDAVELSDLLKLVASSKSLRSALIEAGALRARLFSWGRTAEKTISVFSNM
jgi:glycosyltransferase involved in cell wall biosynthesis